MRRNQFRSLAALLCALSSLSPSLRAADWPQWRGADRSDVSTETGLAKEWPAAGPKRLWVFENAGNGYSGFSVVDNHLFSLGTRDDAEIVFALDASSGKEIWSAKVGAILGNNWGDGPRGTPAVHEGKVYALGGKGDLVCVDAKTGKEAWRTTMKSLGGSTPDWGYTESPLVDGDRVVCTPGGEKGAIAALDRQTGKLIWQSKDFTDRAQYSSIVFAQFGEERQYVQLTMKSVVGIRARDGELLWRSEWPGRVAVIPTPIYHEGHVYVTAGYGVGCKLIRLEAGGKTEDVYVNKVMKNHHGGVIKIGDALYGHSDGAGWVCQDFKTGELVLNEKEKLGKGAIAYADGRFYCLDESSGTVALIEASREGWKEHGRFTIEPQTEIRDPDGRIWTHPVISGGRLFLRDQDKILCYDVRAKT
jgi:outer membrane protein assembly factor BamB